MSQLNFHNQESSNSLSLSRKVNFPILQKTIVVYKIWHSYFKHLPKLSRYSLGNKIDNLFLGFIESVHFAIYSSKTGRKLALQKMSKKLDVLKLFLQLGWEVELLDNKKYSVISIPLAEIGKIIGEWKKQTKE